MAPERPKDAPKTLRGGVVPHKLTAEDRRKGALNAAAAKRRRREQREMSRRELADEKLADLLRELEAGNVPDRPLLLQVIREVLDRDVGKAVTRVETKSLNVTASLGELSQEQLQALAALAPRPELPPAA